MRKLKRSTTSLFLLSESDELDPSSDFRTALACQIQGASVFAQREHALAEQVGAKWLVEVKGDKDYLHGVMGVDGARVVGEDVVFPATAGHYLSFIVGANKERVSV